MININHGKFLINILIRRDDKTLIKADDILNSIRSLCDIILKLNLKTVSLVQSDYYDTKTICKSLIRNQTPEEKANLIYENHATKIGGHKEVNKIYHRLRQNFYWPTMKRDIQEYEIYKRYLRNCRNCQIKKLTKIKTKQPMLIIDTPGAAFDKISMDVMGSLPIIKNNNSYILTIQDLLTKYSVALFSTITNGRFPIYC